MTNKFTHLKTSGLYIQPNMHISHIMKYVSAYQPTEEMWKQLRDDIEACLQKARETSECQYLDQDGELFLEIAPAGIISVCVRWKMYEVVKNETNKT